MSNADIANFLNQIADYLEIKGEDFKPRAYRKTAQFIESMSEDIAEYHKKKKLTDLPTIGEGIAKKISEFLEGGPNYLKKLQKQMPVDVEALLRVDGLGPRKIKVLYEGLHIKTLKQLEKAAKAGKVRTLEGFGEKSEQQFLNSLAFAKASGERMLLGQALPIAAHIVSRLKPHCTVVEVAGSLRRRKETIGDIDILAVPKNADQLIKAFTKLPDVRTVLAQGHTKSSVKLTSGIQIDLRVIRKNQWGAALNYFTGSKQHNVALRARGKRQGLKLNEYGLFKGNKLIASKTESDIYKKLGLHYIEPELRENQGEIAAQLPKLVSLEDVKGDLQMHSTYSDGTASVKDMAEKATSLGYEYIAITDHFGITPLVKSLNIKMYEKQIKECRKVKSIKIFTGMEVDIKKDGSLAAPTKALKMADVVVASIHLGLKEPKGDMTKRIITAMENRYTAIWGHPTARLLNKRRPIECDIEKVFQAAKDNGKVLEVNCHPQRLDLKDTHVRKAIEMGCKLSFGTDAHSVVGLENMRYGVFTARRGWAEKKDVINTKKLKDVKF